MRIHSFVAPKELQKETVTLSSTESHHLSRVLRVEPGQELTLFDGQGTRAEGAVETVAKKEVTVRITARETVPPPAVEITLIQAVCKPDRFEIILQKATELGVRNIVPVVTANASLPAGKIEKMIGRGEAIIRNAAQQCGTAWLPTFQPLEPTASGLATFFQWLEKSDENVPRFGNVDVAFIGSLHPNAVPFKKAFEELKAGGTPAIHFDSAQDRRTAGVPPALRVALLIGPEGDFTEEEVNTAVEAGAIPVTFGKQILRTETAAIFGLSVLSYELL